MVFCMPENAPEHPALSSTTKSIAMQERIPDRIQDCDGFLSDIINYRNHHEMFNEKAFSAQLLTGSDIPAIAGGGYERICSYQRSEVP